MKYIKLSSFLGAIIEKIADCDKPEKIQQIEAYQQDLHYLLFQKP